MYEPDIRINQELMETLTLEEKQSWVESSPTKVFDIDPVTQQVSLISASAAPALVSISLTIPEF